MINLFNITTGVIVCITIWLLCLICYIIMILKNKYSKKPKQDCYNCMYHKLIHRGESHSIDIYRCTKLNKVEFEKASKRHKFIYCKDCKNIK